MGKHPFDYHRPSLAQVDQIQEFRGSCKLLAEAIENLPEGRERAIAMTKLEEVSMWGNKAIIMADEGPVVDFVEG